MGHLVLGYGAGGRYAVGSADGLMSSVAVHDELVDSLTVRVSAYGTTWFGDAWVIASTFGLEWHFTRS
jgi:hypothetical protein